MLDTSARHKKNNNKKNKNKKKLVARDFAEEICTVSPFMAVVLSKT